MDRLATSGIQGLRLALAFKLFSQAGADFGERDRSFR
jgi:hypothetical protein